MKQMLCNPLNLEYRYQIKKTTMGDSVFREAADPTMILFKDVYLMFASMSGGFWYSEDLISWAFKETPELPIYDYAPDVRVVGGKVIFSASKREGLCSFFRSEDPINKPFEAISSPFAFWDPSVFEDDDGCVYFYWGCSNKEPIWGIEMNTETFQPIGEKVALFGENEEEHGWERTGENNKVSEPKTQMDKWIREYLGTKPFIEGAFMTKYNNRYYLQYAAPGTESNVYSDGVYVSDAPLGPFAYQEHNPFSSKPGGFITAAGHGSTFQDKFGNWWHISSMRISVNENFERRIGLFPCDFDKDGVLHCNQNFADYPFCIPQKKRENMLGTAPEMSLLSYNKSTSASSWQEEHEPQRGADENIRTWWAAANPGKEQWFSLDLGDLCKVGAIQVNFADHKMNDPACNVGDMHSEDLGHRLIKVRPQVTEYTLEGSTDGEQWATIKDTHNKANDFAHDFIQMDVPQTLRYFRLSNMHMPFGGVPAVSGLRVFGVGNGVKPRQVSGVQAIRNDRRNIQLSWHTSPAADGYNVRYGISPNKLYNSWQVIGNAELDLSMVNAASGYYVAIDSYNENGVTSGETFFVG